MSRFVGVRLTAQPIGRIWMRQAGQQCGLPALLQRGRWQQCAIVAVDIADFGDHRRDDDIQLYVRRAMYQVLRQGFARSGISWRNCRSEDRGDGALIVVRPCVPTSVLIDPLLEYLRAGLRHHNKVASEAAKIRLRMALHTGHIHFDENGVVGRAVVKVFRMLNAPLFKQAFAASAADIGLVTSNELYEDLIQHGPGLIDPDAYRLIDVSLKETRSTAWVYFPPVAAPHVLDGSLWMQPAGERLRDVAQ